MFLIFSMTILINNISSLRDFARFNLTITRVDIRAYIDSMPNGIENREKLSSIEPMRKTLKLSQNHNYSYYNSYPRSSEGLSKKSELESYYNTHFHAGN